MLPLQVLKEAILHTYTVDKEYNISSVPADSANATSEKVASQLENVLLGLLVCTATLHINLTVLFIQVLSEFKVERSRQWFGAPPNPLHF